MFLEDLKKSSGLYIYIYTYLSYTYRLSYFISLTCIFFNILTLKNSDYYIYVRVLLLYYPKQKYLGKGKIRVGKRLSGYAFIKVFFFLFFPNSPAIWVFSGRIRWQRINPRPKIYHLLVLG